MRKVMMLLALLTGLAPVVSADSGVVVDRAGAVNFNQDILAEGYRSLSVQVEYATLSPATPSVSDGKFSSTTITVGDYSLLTGVKSSATITVLNGQNESLSGVYVSINGQRWTQGVQWEVGYTSTRTATNIAAAIDASFEYEATASSNVVTVLYYQVGTAGNSYTSATSAATKISFTPFSAGQAAGYLSINGTTLTEGTDWTASVDADTTANSIEDAINANATLSEIVLASNTYTGVVTLTAKNTGINAYPISVSNAAALTPLKYRLSDGMATEISVADNTFDESAHALPVGLPVLYSTAADKGITGLTWQTTYYVIPYSANSFKLASSALNAVAGTAIDITAVAGGGTYTFTPLTFSAAAGNGFKFQGSNDGTTFYDLDISSLTYSASGGNIWSFSDYVYKWLRFAFTKPTAGAIDLNATFSGRK